MNSKEFLERLDILLQDIPQEERAEAIRFYTEYFSEAGPEMEQSILTELGSPEEVAQAVRQSIPHAAPAAEQQVQEPIRNIPVPVYARRTDGPGYQYGQQNGPQYTRADAPKRDRKSVTILVVLAAVLTFPIWGSLALSLLGIAFAIVVASLAFLFAGGVTAIASLVLIALKAVTLFSAGVGSGLLAIGLLLLVSAVGLVLMGLGAFVLFWLIPAICRVTKKYIIDPLRGKGGVSV